MISATTSLSSSQLKFLENNFVVYDPDSGECHKDFSAIPQCQVILIGETHYTHILHKIQGLFLKQIPPKGKSCCVLKETLSVGEKFKASQIPFWNDVPDHIMILGSDIRYKITSEEYLECQKLEHELRVLDLDYKKALEDLNRRMAAILNRDFDSHAIQEDDTFLIADEIQTQFDNLDKQKLNAIIGKRDPLAEKSQKVESFTSNDELTVTKSNEGLYQEILKALKVYDLVIGIWGDAHWFLGEKIFKKMTKKIKFLVIIPNEEINKEVQTEYVWRKEEVNNLTLKLKNRKKTKVEGNLVFFSDKITTIKIPEPFKDYYLPQIRRLFKKLNGNPCLEIDSPCLEIGRDNLALFAKEETVVVPAFRPIKFVGFNCSNYESLYDICSRDKTIDIPLLKLSINNMLVFAQKSLSSIKIKANFQRVVFKYENQLPIFQFTSKEAVEIVLKSDELYCTAEHFFSEMYRKGIKEFKVGANRELHFLLEDGEDFPENFNSWLDEKVPRLHLEVFLQNKPGLIRYNDENGKPCSLALSTKKEEGFKILLCKKKVELDKSESKSDSE